MSLRSMISDFLDRTIEARFKRDNEGRLIFFPMGFGRGRIVPDAATENLLRQGCRRLMIVTFAAIIPIASAVGVLQLEGTAFLLYVAACVVFGFAAQIYPLWLARALPRSNSRLSFFGASLHSLSGFGLRFKIFGLIACLLFSGVAAIMLATGDRTVAIVSLLIFLPMAIAYGVAIIRHRRASA
ncbi:MAG: hypothetical protein R3D67_19210 [Hyphomicrobiaceae bacterium]